MKTNHSGTLLRESLMIPSILMMTWPLKKNNERSLGMPLPSTTQGRRKLHNQMASTLPIFSIVPQPGGFNIADLQHCSDIVKAKIMGSFPCFH